MTINNYSVVDGLKVVISSFAVNIAQFILVLIFARPTEWEDERRNELATTIFVQLVIGHIFFAVTNYLDTFWYKHSVQFTIVSLLFKVMIAI